MLFAFSQIANLIHTRLTQDLQKRAADIDLIRMDIYAGVHEAPDTRLVQFVPGYQRRNSVISLGKKVLEEVEMRSACAVEIKATLEERLPGLELGVAIKKFVEESVADYGLDTTTAEVIDLLERASSPKPGLAVFPIDGVKPD